MKVAIDISPTKTGHKDRGIGNYTNNLINEFKKKKWANVEFDFFENPASPPPVDVVHYPYFDLFFNTLPIKKKTSRVVTIHDVIPLVFPKHFPSGIKGNINLLLQKQALKNVDAIICDSNTSKKDIIEILAMPEDKIHVIYLSAGKEFKPISDKNLLSTVAKKYDLPQEFVLYVGDINWSKNIPNLLKAVKRANVNLVMIGEALTDKSLPETKSINNLISELKIENRVLKTGYVKGDDLVAIYNLAPLTVLPSFYEGFGLPVLESMVCGTPVICSNVASLAEIGKDAAVFCDPTDPSDISKKIDATLKLTTTQKEKASKKLINHANKFSWEKVAQETIKIYGSLL